MKILIVGGGGREHAFAWKAAQSPRVAQIFVAPGNAGTAAEPRTRNVDIEASDLDGLLHFARKQAIDLTIVGPEAPLVAGVVDRFQDAGRRIFGPTQAAAQLEGSKAFAKDFLARHGIPTAAYDSFSDKSTAVSYISKVGAPLVVKADGLAAGKGVVIALDESTAAQAVEDMLERHTFGAAGAQVVIEEFLQGEEASFIVMVDGEHVLPLATSQDHKRVGDGDTGPNTGGMGAYSPAPVVTQEIDTRIMEEVIGPTVRGLAAEGHPYTGFLYAGLMIAADGTPRVLEYNCRFGDPETQPIMLRLKSDLIELIDAALDTRLDAVQVEWDARTAMGVVMAAGGYPGSYNKGDEITGLPQQPLEDVKVFHAGTSEMNGRVVTAGGRVLCVTALGATVGAAQKRAYEVVENIHWKDVYYRHDIGYRAIAREK